jgi:cytidylate kinase
LTIADDAIVIDTTSMSIDDVVGRVMRIVDEALSRRAE